MDAAKVNKPKGHVSTNHDNKNVIKPTIAQLSAESMSKPPTWEQQNVPLSTNAFGEPVILPPRKNDSTVALDGPDEIIGGTILINNNTYEFKKTNGRIELYGLTEAEAVEIHQNPQVIYNGEQMSFNAFAKNLINPVNGESFKVVVSLTDRAAPMYFQFTYRDQNVSAITYGETGNNASETSPEPEAKQPVANAGSSGEASAESPVEDSNAMEEAVQETEQVSAAPVGPYWTHEWHVDRFGRETVFIWQAGGKRWYPKPGPGYAYIRKMANMTPEDAEYDPRFERFRHRPNLSEGKNPELNWWFKKSPGWDDPQKEDDGTADFEDLAEFKDAPHNKKGTGFYYMGYRFDPLIYEKLEAEKRRKENQQYIGTTTNYKGYVSAPAGIILHQTPTPSDSKYWEIKKSDNKSDFVISLNQPITVIAEANEENEGWVMIKTASGEEGWIERRYISMEPIVETEDLFPSYIVKEGDNLEGLIKSYYTDYPYATGNDRRTVALAIYLYNKDRPGSGVYRNYQKYKNAGSWKDYVDPWMQETRANYQSIELYAGGKVLLPPKEFIEEMRKQGKLEKRPDFVNIMIEGGRVLQGFIAGVGIGFWDALVGAGEDLYNMIVDIFTGEIFNQIAEMFEMIWELGLSGIWDMIAEWGTTTWKEITDAWNNPNPYERGKYFGEIIGMILFEVVLALVTWGIGSAFRNSARVQKILKWFPDLNKKKIVPDNVDHYADDIKRLNKDKGFDVDEKKIDINKDSNIEVPESAKKYESDIDASRKKELEAEAQKELDNDPAMKDRKNTDEYKKKLAALALAKVITEGADLKGLSVQALNLELSFLEKLPEVKDFEFEGSGGIYKVYMIGSKFLVDGKYTESGEGKYRIIGKSKTGNVLQEGDNKFGWQHIVEGHIDGKSGKTMFPKGISKSKIKELILEASEGSDKLFQGERIKVTKTFKPSKYGISEMIVWINKNGNFIESAYPTKGNGVWKFP